MDRPREHDDLADEIENFEEIARYLKPSPGDVPVLEGIEIAGVSRPLLGNVGGDHVIYIDFNRRYDLDARVEQALRAGRADVAAELRRNRTRAGILVADVAGHRVTDGVVAAMLHQAFLLGSYYELEMFGQITTKLFENIKTRFYESTSVNKYLTMIYGEIAADGVFRYISAGHQPPLVFSREFGRLAQLGPDRTIVELPIGFAPSTEGPDRRRFTSLDLHHERYEVNEIRLMAVGDVLLLSTDGLTEHADGRYVPERLELLLSSLRDRPAAEISARLLEDMLGYAAPQDDIAIVVVKRTA